MAPRITRHSNAAPASPENSHSGLSFADGVAGAESKAGAAGAVRSRSYEEVAAGPVLPAASVARTEKP